MNPNLNLGINRNNNIVIPPVNTDNNDIDTTDLSDLMNTTGPSDNTEDYGYMAKNDVDSGRSSGITKEQLDALHKHEGANMWTSLFMNMAGAANGIQNGAKYAAPLAQRVEQERQGLEQQQNLANSQFNRGAQEQKMAVSDINLSNLKRQQAQGLAPVNTLQKAYLYSLAKTGKLQGVEPNDIESATQNDYENLVNPAKGATDVRLKQQEVQNTQAMNAAKAQTLVPVKNPDGTISYGFASKFTGDVNPLANTVPLQSTKMDQQSARDFTKNLNPETIQAHEAVQNYDTALEGLKPQEAQQADDLARRQISAIAGKFDQGSKPNSITSMNQFLNSLFKMEQTSEFNTPDNPAIGQAAFRRVKSALEFSALTQAQKSRATNFQTQFSLGNSFGANLAGQPVPQEKIDELKNETKQNIGGNLQKAISSSSNPDIGKQKAKELFEDRVDDYLNAYHNIRGPGNKTGSASSNQQQVPKKVWGSFEDYKNSLQGGQ